MPVHHGIDGLGTCNVEPSRGPLAPLRMLGVLDEVRDDPDCFIVAVVHATVTTRDDIPEVRHGINVDLLLIEDRCPALEVRRRRERHPRRVDLAEVRIIHDVPLLEVQEGLVGHITEGHVRAIHVRMQCPRCLSHVVRVHSGALAHVEVLQALHARGVIPVHFDTRVQLGLLRPSRPTVVPLMLPTGVGAVFSSFPAGGVAPAAWRDSRIWRICRFIGELWASTAKCGSRRRISHKRGS